MESAETSSEKTAEVGQDCLENAEDLGTDDSSPAIADNCKKTKEDGEVGDTGENKVEKAADKLTDDENSNSEVCKENEDVNTSNGMKEEEINKNVSEKDCEISELSSESLGKMDATQEQENSATVEDNQKVESKDAVTDAGKVISQDATSQDMVVSQEVTSEMTMEEVTSQEITQQEVTQQAVSELQENSNKDEKEIDCKTDCADLMVETTNEFVNSEKELDSVVKSDVVDDTNQTEKVTENTVNSKTDQILPESANIKQKEEDCVTELENSSDDKTPQMENIMKGPKTELRSEEKDVNADSQGGKTENIEKEPLSLVKTPEKEEKQEDVPTICENDIVLSESNSSPKVEEILDVAVSEKDVCENDTTISDTSIISESTGTDEYSSPVKEIKDTRQPKGTGLYRTYKCKGCKYNTPIKTNLRRHASINIEYKPFLCRFCGTRFTDKSTLNFHNKTRHNNYENFDYNPEEEKERAIDKYLEECIELETKVKSPEGVSRNPSKYKDCNLVTFDLFKNFESRLPKKLSGKKSKSCSSNFVTSTDKDSPTEKNLVRRKVNFKPGNQPIQRQTLIVTYPDGSTMQQVKPVMSQDEVYPSEIKKTPGRKKKVHHNGDGEYTAEKGSVQSSGGVTTTQYGEVTDPAGVTVSSTGMLAGHHMQAPGISVIQTFGGLGIPMQIPMAVQMPIGIPTAIQPNEPLNMTTGTQINQSPLQTSSPPDLTGLEEKKKRGRTKTIREILNLDNGLRRPKKSNSHGSALERQGTVMRSSQIFGQGRKRGRRPALRHFQLKKEQNLMKTPVDVNDNGRSEGTPDWPVKLKRKRGRPPKIAMLSASRQDNSIGSIGAVGVKRKYMRMKLVGTSSDQFGSIGLKQRTQTEECRMQSKNTTGGIKRKQFETSEESDISPEKDVPVLKKKPGRKRKIDCVTDVGMSCLEKKSKLMASETGILTEETINNSLLALKKKQENITATGVRVKRKYVRRAKNISSVLLSTSSSSSTMEEQRDCNELGSSTTKDQSAPLKKTEGRKRGRPVSIKNKMNSLQEKRNRPGRPLKKRLRVASPESVTNSDFIIHCDKCSKSRENASSDKKRNPRLNDSPGRAICLCDNGGYGVDSKGNALNTKTSVKKPILSKSARMANYVKKYSQKYSKLAKAKSQGKDQTTGQQLIKCPLCPYQSKSVNGIRIHAFWLHKMCKYTCAYCSYSTLHRHEGIAHYKTQHPGKTINLVRKSCIMDSLEEDNTGGSEGKVMTLAIDGQASPCKQQTPSKDTKVMYDSRESKSSPSKSPGAPQLDVMNKSLYTEDSLAPKGRCPQCDYISTIRGVGQHLMLAHNMLNFVCKECNFKSQSKAITIAHVRKKHKHTRPEIYKKVISVKPDPDLTNEMPLPTGASTPKTKGNISDEEPVNVSPTMPKLKKIPKAWKLKLATVKDRESLQQFIAKRKGKFGKDVIQTGSACTSEEENPISEEPATSYTLHPRRMESLKVGFSCVYCYYAAPLRHQLHLHCYDKHTNHPACLMKFTKDGAIQDLFGDTPLLKLSSSKEKQIEVDSDATKKEMTLDYGRVHRIIKWSSDDISDVNDDYGVQGEVDEKGDGSRDTDVKNQNDEMCFPELGESRSSKTDSDGKDIITPFPTEIPSVKPQKVNVPSATTDGDPSHQLSEPTTISPTLPSGRPGKLRMGCQKTFANPLTPLVARLGAGKVKLRDTFQSSLDDIDSILSSFGVRTLNMDMLTRKQFTDFIQRFGSGLQQM